MAIIWVEEENNMIVERIGFKDEKTFTKYERNERIHSWMSMLVLSAVILNLGIEKGIPVGYKSHTLLNTFLIIFVLVLCIVSIFALVRRRKLLKKSFKIDEATKSHKYKAVHTKIDTWTSSILTIGLFVLFILKLIELF